MTLTGKWVKDQAGDLVMKWTGDEVPAMKPNAEARQRTQVRLTTSSAPPAWSPALCSGMAHTQGTGREHDGDLGIKARKFPDRRIQAAR